MQQRFWTWRSLAAATALVGLPGIVMAQAGGVPTITCSGTGASALNTGGAATGGVDDYWRYLGLPAYAGTGAAASTPASSYGAAYLSGSSQWYTPPAGSPWQWVAASPGPGQPVIPGNTNVWGNVDALFRIDFSLDSSVNPREFAPAMRFWADNSVVDIMVNGRWQGPLDRGLWTALPQAGSANQFGFDAFSREWRGTTITMASPDWRSGANSLVVYVKSGVPLMGFGANLTSTSVCPNQVPTAIPTLTGTTTVGSGVSGSYTYSDANTDAEDVSATGSTFRLVSSSDTTLTPTSPITVLASGPAGGAGVSQTLHTLQAADVGKYLYYCVTPAAQTGASPGNEACTAAFGPVVTQVPPAAPAAVPTLSTWALTLLSAVLGVGALRGRRAKAADKR